MKYITTEIQNGVAIVTFCRPPINAVDLEANIEISETFENFNHMDEVKCVIFRSEGKGFISGSDTGEFDGFDDALLKANEDADIRSVLAIENCRVPVICQIQGYVMGLGTCLAAACDLIVAADDAYFGQPEVRLCVVGGTGALRQLMPEKFMRYMAFTGKKIGVQKIAEFGSILKIIPREQALNAALEVAAEITENYTRSVQCVKSAIKDLINRDSEHEYRIDCEQTHILLVDPQRDAILADYNEKLRLKRVAKEKKI